MFLLLISKFNLSHLFQRLEEKKKKNIKEGSVDHDLSNYFDFWS